jgi:hypothetical protein
MSHREHHSAADEVFNVIFTKLFWCNGHHNGVELGKGGDNLELASLSFLYQMLAVDALFNCRNKRPLKMNAQYAPIESIFLNPFGHYLQGLLSVFEDRCN